MDRHRIILRTATLALSIATIIALPLAAGAQGNAQPKLPTVELKAGMHLIRAEVAATDPTRSQGLMFRKHLEANDGMLFVFQRKQQLCFWMRNTTIPLTIAFLDDNGSIVNLADMQPLTEDAHCSSRPARFALEMRQGWFVRRAIRAGFVVQGPAGLFSGN